MASEKDIEELAAINALTPFEQREWIIGFNDAGVEVYKNPSSMLIGGPTNSGKSVVAAYFCLWIVLMDGRLLVCDPHCNNKSRGLTAKISPLRDWFAQEPLDFTNKQKVLDQFEYMEAELIRREQPGGITPSRKMMWLIVDEFNEFLSRLSREERKRVCTIIGNTARSGAKHGLFCLLLAHQWDLSKAGGSEIRYNVMLRLCTGGEYRQMSMVLDTEEERVKALWKPPIRKGDVLVRMPDYDLRRLHYPNVEKHSCENIAALVKRSVGSPITYSQTSEELAEHLNTTPEYSGYSAYSGLNIKKTANPTHDLNNLNTEYFSTPIEPNKPSQCLNNLNIPPPDRDTPAQIAPRVDKFGIPAEERTRIITVGAMMRVQTGRVVRTQLRDRLGYNSYQYEHWLKPLCDELGWNARMQAKKELSTTEKQALREQAGKCALCGESTDNLEVDHRWPKSLGGTLEPENLQILCKHCNQKKGIKHAQ